MRCAARVLLAGALLVAGCGGERGGYTAIIVEEPPGGVSVGIDADAMLVAEPGVGAGVQVSYSAGGQWRIATTCDAAVNTNAVPCWWDLVASIGRSLTLDVRDMAELEADDQVQRPDPAAARLLLTTDVDVDGVVLVGPPGRPLELDVMLDGVHDAAFLSWVQNGAVHSGSLSNPVIFVPTAP